MGAKLRAADLRGKIIDVHSHAGLMLKSYARLEYPCAETLEALYFKQLAAGVGANVVFPLGPELFCNLPYYIRTGTIKKAVNPISACPYQLENLYLLREAYDFCPELSGRFLPFVCFDPGWYQTEQMRQLQTLYSRYPFYGIKVIPVLCQTQAIKMLDFPAIFRFAEKHNLPFLFHATWLKAEKYSYVGDIFKLIDRYPDNRFCLAHCLGFHEPFLNEAAGRENTWVDTAALKIQVQIPATNHPAGVPAALRLKADYSDFRKVLRTLMEKYPDTIIWGSDSPAYSYITRRKNADGSFTEFKLKGTYLDEKQALDSLPPEFRTKAASVNSLKFLFGKE